MCDFNCLNCTFHDCICDVAPTTNEIIILDEIDDAIDFGNRADQARINGTIKTFRSNHSEKGKARLAIYNHSEKGKSRCDRYNHSEKGKARLQKYYQSEKGKENEKRKAERRRMARLQQKGCVANGMS